MQKCPTCGNETVRADVSLRCTNAPVVYLSEPGGMQIVTVNDDEFGSLANREVVDVYCTSPGCEWGSDEYTDVEFA